jgi:hypothetical protein
MLTVPELACPAGNPSRREAGRFSRAVLLITSKNVGTAWERIGLDRQRAIIISSTRDLAAARIRPDGAEVGVRKNGRQTVSIADPDLVK